MATKTTDRRTAARRLEHIVIECVTPVLDGGRHAVKRVVGDDVVVGADVIKEGHDLLSARVLYRGPGDSAWSAAPMTFDYDSDRWYGTFQVDRVGEWAFAVEAWTDRFGTWRAGLEKKIAANQDVQLELSEGARMARAASRSTKSPTARASLQRTARMLDDRRDTAIEKQLQRAVDDDLLALMREHSRPNDATQPEREYTIVVDRPIARFAAWYEMFPRSQTKPGPGAAPRHGTFDDAAARLPRIAELGFDGVSLPPIHPIGRSHRKGKNNALAAEPDDVGSPWAIGNEQGGHTAIDPALGTIDDFDRFVATARDMDLEVALD
ncbi:MAG: maltotransferase domain-containing protein, partial [Gemmatimonadales bacterium]